MEALKSIIDLKNFKQKLLTALCAILFVARPGIGAPSPQKETVKAYQVKAVFLFNFAQFVEWPRSAFPAAASPLIIGVLGKNPFNSYLDEIIHGEQINGRPLIIKRYSDADDVKNCHILFLNLKDYELEKALQKLKGRHILTVSDDRDFIPWGGIIQFTTVNNKIRMKINQTAATNSDLIISSKLLKLADIVYSKK